MSIVGMTCSYLITLKKWISSFFFLFNSAKSNKSIQRNLGSWQRGILESLQKENNAIHSFERWRDHTLLAFGLFSYDAIRLEKESNCSRKSNY